MDTIARRLEAVLQRIESAARSCGRDPRSIHLLAVSKTFPPAAVEEAIQAGQVLFGENRVQEAEEKIPAVRSNGTRWHLIGHLQSNKTRKAVQIFDVIETLDSEKVISRVARAAEEFEKDLPVFIQVNVGAEEQKSGVLPAELPRLLDLVDGQPRLKLQGLMAIPPFEEDPEAGRQYFRKLRRLLEESNRNRVSPMSELSMGMSHDFHVAIEEGATLVRVGSAIFGPRTG